MPSELPDGIRRAIFPVRRPGALLTCWFWRYEGLGTLAAVIGTLHLERSWGPGSSLALLAMVVGLVVASRIVRRWVFARLRVIWVQHRLRVGFVEAGLFSSLGRLPWLLWTAPAGTGEEAFVILPAGVTTEQVCEAGPVLAGAAWASEVRVRPHPGRTHLIVIEVLRREGSS